VPEAEDQVLLAEIQAQAEAVRERVLAEGRGRAAAFRSQAEQEIRRLEAEATRQLERRLAMDKERIRGDARLAAGVRVLAAKREWVDRAFQAARRRLAERCASPQYGPQLKRLLREASAAAGGEVELRVAKADVELARSLVRELGLPQEVRAEGGEPGTAIAVSPGRRADNSLETRLREACRSLEQEVARLLFGGPLE